MASIGVTFSSVRAESDLSQKGEQAIIKDDPRVKLELNQQTQNPADNTIKFVLKIVSKINSDRARLTWKLSGQSNFLNPKSTSVVLKLRENQTYYQDVTIVPVPFVPKKGEAAWKANEILAQIDVVLIDGIIQSTARLNFATSYDGLALPITKEFEDARSSYQLTQTLTRIFLVAGSVVLGYILFRFIRRWVQIDERDLYEKTGKVPNGLFAFISSKFKKRNKNNEDTYEY